MELFIVNVGSTQYQMVAGGQLTDVSTETL